MKLLARILCVIYGCVHALEASAKAELLRVPKCMNCGESGPAFVNRDWNM